MDATSLTMRCLAWDLETNLLIFWYSFIFAKPICPDPAVSCAVSKHNKEDLSADMTKNVCRDDVHLPRLHKHDSSRFLWTACEHMSRHSRIGDSFVSWTNFCFVSLCLCLCLLPGGRGTAGHKRTQALKPCLTSSGRALVFPLCSVGFPAAHFSSVCSSHGGGRLRPSQIWQVQSKVVESGREFS